MTKSVCLSVCLFSVFNHDKINPNRNQHPNSYSDPNPIPNFDLYYNPNSNPNPQSKEGCQSQFPAIFMREWLELFC